MSGELEKEEREELITYALRYGGPCRGCADEDGTCPTTGIPCDAEVSRRVLRRAFAAWDYGAARGFCPPLDATERAAREKAERERDEARHEFKNFHRNLCERFDYCHDEKDWRRDQVSLIEHIARRAEKVGAEKDVLRGALTAARDRFNAMRRTPYADEMAIMAKEGAFASHAALSPSPGEKP